MDTERRTFIKNSGIAAAAVISAPMIISACSRGKDGHPGPSDKVNLAVIGAGNQGSNDTRGFLEDDRVQITAVCDVNEISAGYWDGKVAGRKHVKEFVEAHYSEKTGKKFKGVREFTDFREVMDRKDIDAVLIALPDHWHCIPTLMAAAKGKDIYCQKPLSLTIAEGRAMSNAVKKHNVILQTGSQQRSNHHFRRVCELVRNGRIGDLHTVRCGLPGGTPDYGRTGLNLYPQPVPKGFDYDMWLGPAPEAAYRPCCSHVNFRWVLDYSGGQLTDWGGHHPDIAQWGMDTELTGPVKIQNARASCALHPVWNTASDYYFEALYNNGVRLIITNEENEIKLYKSDNHYRNFIDCVYSR